MLKSELRNTVNKVLEDHDLQDGDLAEDLVDRISQDIANEVMDDEEAPDEEEG